MHLASNFTFVKGIGKDSKSELLSFDTALCSAGIGNYNIVRVSSILPPKAVKKNSVEVLKGSVLYVAYATATIYGAGRIASAISVGIPKSPSEIGVIMEYSAPNDRESVIECSREMVKKSMEFRGIALKDILSVGVEEVQEEQQYLTTFAGIVLW